MLAAANLPQLEAGMQPHAQHHTVLVGKELLLGPLNHREEINWKVCTGGEIVSHFPEYLPLMFITCCAI